MAEEKIRIRRIRKKELSLELFHGFQRHQAVTKCIRKENGAFVEKDIAFTEDWVKADYETLLTCLNRTLLGGGVIYGAFCGDGLVGFASVEKARFGEDKQYSQLSSLHVSEPYRGQGIGKRLFWKAKKAAVSFGAKKLYVSSHSAVETQHFYRAMGCKEAEEYNEELASAEPCDCQLECPVENKYLCRMVGMVTGGVMGLVYGNMVMERTPLGFLFGLAAGFLVGALLDRGNRKQKGKEEKEEKNGI